MTVSRTRAVSWVLVLAVAALSVVTLTGYGQSSLEEWAEQQISERTGIDPQLLATLFIQDGDNQFILSFVFINEEVLQSDLRPELKSEIRPYVGERAMMAMIVPTKRSTFDPTAISFAQGRAVHLVDSASITPITEGFGAGPVPAQEVNAGVISLPQGINLDEPFQIRYQDGFETTFALNPEDGKSSETVRREEIEGTLLFLLQMILTLFLFPFLI